MWQLLGLLNSRPSNFGILECVVLSSTTHLQPDKLLVPFRTRKDVFQLKVCFISLAGNDIVPRVDIESTVDFILEVSAASPMRSFFRGISKGMAHG